MSGEHHIKKAYESILRNDFEQAIAWFELAIRNEPDNADYHYRLSVSCARSNRLAKAINHALRSTALCPGNETYRFHLQRMHARKLTEEAEKAIAQLRLHDAESMLRRATTLDPLAFEAYLMLAVVYDKLGDPAMALAAAREAHRLDPQHEAALKLVAQYESEWQASRNGNKQFH
ncbi:MAG: tetratricopeptide repeat protein [Paenibacillaceae bacterium]|nr:tetratricopeptide repeat protein [Paenibacillaceae bacterium]